MKEMFPPEKCPKCNADKDGEMRQVEIKFDHWPDTALFPNKAGNTMHWAQRAKLRQACRHEAYLHGMVNDLVEPMKHATIEILVTAKDNRKRDLDGFASAVKSWIDGIVDARILEDDNYFVVPEITIKFVGVGEESVTIVITEIEYGLLNKK